jgi:NAD(P)-dependent dehydrogenase (short-subunit alcohol dehydrogenase family)
LDTFSLDSKVAVVTGASSGIGARAAQVLASAGARVYAVARRKDRLDQISADNTGIIAHQADLTDEDACTRLVDRVIQESGQIDILINNAGVSRVGRAEDESTEDFRTVIELNLVSTFILCREVGSVMLKQDQGGSIVNISSIVGLAGLGRMPQAGYAASKAGVTNLTRELAAQWAARGVRVNAIAPGWFSTEMTSELFDNEHGQQWVAKLTPMRRGGRIEELDGVLLLLSSDASSYMTGCVIPVDGGWTAV